METFQAKHWVLKMIKWERILNIFKEFNSVSKLKNIRLKNIRKVLAKEVK